MVDASGLQGMRGIPASSTVGKLPSVTSLPLRRKATVNGRCRCLPGWEGERKGGETTSTGVRPAPRRGRGACVRAGGVGGGYHHLLAREDVLVTRLVVCRPHERHPLHLRLCQRLLHRHPQLRWRLGRQGRRYGGRRPLGLLFGRPCDRQRRCDPKARRGEHTHTQTETRESHVRGGVLGCSICDAGWLGRRRRRRSEAGLGSSLGVAWRGVSHPPRPSQTSRSSPVGLRAGSAPRTASPSTRSAPS